MERIITRIGVARALGITREEIRASLIGPECSEELFFFCWVAVDILERGL